MGRIIKQLGTAMTTGESAKGGAMTTRRGVSKGSNAIGGSSAGIGAHSYSRKSSEWARVNPVEGAAEMRIRHDTSRRAELTAINRSFWNNNCIKLFRCSFQMNIKPTTLTKTLITLMISRVIKREKMYLRNDSVVSLPSITYEQWYHLNQYERSYHSELRK